MNPCNGCPGEDTKFPTSFLKKDGPSSITVCPSNNSAQGQREMEVAGDIARRYLQARG